MMTALVGSLALSLGVCIGYVLCAAMTVSNREQRREPQRTMPDAAPLKADSRF